MSRGTPTTPGILAAAMLVATLAIAGCDSDEPSEGTAAGAPETPLPSSPSEPVPGDWVAAQPADYHLAARIRLRILSDPAIRDPGDDTAIHGLHVNVTNRVVTLEGQTGSGFARARAEAIADRAFGVSRVDNRIDGPEPSRSERTRAERVPARVAAVEPVFAQALVNYATGEPVARYAVPTRSRDRVPPDAIIPGVDPVALPELDNVAHASAVELPAEAEPLPIAVNPNDEPDWTGEYTIQAGETLWSIAADQLGDGNAWQVLFEENRDIIGDDPNGIRVGMRIRLPR